MSISPSCDSILKSIKSTEYPATSDSAVCPKDSFIYVGTLQRELCVQSKFTGQNQNKVEVNFGTVSTTASRSAAAAASSSNIETDDSGNTVVVGGQDGRSEGRNQPCGVCPSVRPSVLHFCSLPSFLLPVDPKVERTLRLFGLSRRRRRR